MDDGAMGKTFRGWLKGPDADSRIAFRELLRDYKYESMLDVAAGLCDEYYGIVEAGIDIEYSAIDITPKLVEYNISKGVDIKKGSIEKIPHKANTFDICYARHILEHLDYYEKAVSEMIRVSRRAVAITFFRKPLIDDMIDYIPKEDLYQNIYGQSKMENFISSKRKVDRFQWLQPESLKHGGWDHGEVILHIILK